MSRKFKVDIQTVASATVQVEISDERLALVAADLGVSVDELTIEDLEDEITVAYTPPRICAQCSGWGSNYGMSLGDDWEVSVYPENGPFSSAVCEVTGE